MPKPGNSGPIILRCAVPAPLPHGLDYVLPAGWAREAAPMPGTRVRVPLGRRMVTAVVLEQLSSTDVELSKLKPIEAALDETPLLDPTILTLAQWVARYYLHPTGEVISLALSPLERAGRPPAGTGAKGIRLNSRGRGLPAGALSRAPKQSAALALLNKGPQRLDQLSEHGFGSAIVRSLREKGLVEECRLEPDPDWSARAGKTPSDQQLHAIEAISKGLGSFSCHLLDGVTGSGKTEVYMQCIAHTLAVGKQALVLLPEIGLTPQMIQRFEARFDAPIAVIHSGLSRKAREQSQALARSGNAAIVLGTRSAVFVPVRRLGLIIVDEEHDNAFSQQDGLRYSARDVAVKRAQLEGCPAVLGSATPSLESLNNAQAGRYRWHKLTRRAGDAALPAKELIDVRGLALHGGLSEKLVESVQTALDAKQQVLLFLNRRGFATTLLCHDCGWFAGCEHCDANQTVHRTPPGLRCHHCGFRRALPRACPSCGGHRLAHTGLGTEQTEEVLQSLFPGVPLFRVDSDSISTHNQITELNQKLTRLDCCILLGTQMLAKGHHFPRVALVGVIDADSLMFNPDFRGEERLLQLLTQVGGRAGRGETPGRVQIQTLHPDHPLLQAALDEDYSETAQRLLNERYQRGLPPAGALVALRTDSRSQTEGLRFLESLKRSFAREHGALPSHCKLLGPLPASMSRRAGLFRCQLILSGPTRGQTATVAAQLWDISRQARKPAGLSVFMDVDPVEPL